MKKTILVVGIDNFGQTICKDLSENGHIVIALDQTSEKTLRVEPFVEHAATGVLTTSDIYKDLGLGHADWAVVSFPTHFDTAMIIVTILKDLGMTNIICQVTNEYQERIAKMLGASVTIYPDNIASKQTVRKIIWQNVLEHYALDQNYGVYEVIVNTNRYDGMTLRELQFPETYSVNIVLIRRAGVTKMPSKNEVLEKNDVVIVLCEQNKISKFQEILND